MTKLILPKNKIRKLVGKILPDYEVFAPVEIDGVVLFQQITSSSTFTLEFYNTKTPPKNILFQQTEPLFTFAYGKEVKLESAKPGKKTVILGIRPCDAKSFSILDHVFKDEYEDPYYLKKRENTILIGLTCNKPGVNCFCTSLNIEPNSPENVDILLTDIGEKYFVEVISKKGKKLIDSLPGFTKPTKNDEKEKVNVEKKANAAIKRHMDTGGIANKLDKIFENPYWKEIAMKCLGCGTCTYLCPTCHCFDIQDEATRKKGARVRVWDSCMYPEYTRQSSGYNPRPERMNRIRNRVYHKYNYYPKNYDVIACVGCGRCIDACPVNMDVIDIVSKVKGVKND